MKKKLGKIIIPFGTVVQKHELNVAEALVATGFDVEFIPVGLLQTPDITFNSKKWEIKSPTGKSSRTIENNLRNALRQSPHVILDLQRIKLPEAACIRETKRQLTLLPQIKSLLVVTKTKKILDITSSLS